MGKFLNPLFLALLGILIVLAFVKPLGHVASAAVGENYISSPFFKGFTEGYNTLDALASLALGLLSFPLYEIWASKNQEISLKE